MWVPFVFCFFQKIEVVNQSTLAFLFVCVSNVDTNSLAVAKDLWNTLLCQLPFLLNITTFTYFTPCIYSFVLYTFLITRNKTFSFGKIRLSFFTFKEIRLCSLFSYYFLSKKNKVYFPFQKIKVSVQFYNTFFFKNRTFFKKK